MQHNGYVIDDMFFGLWLLPLGYLVIKPGYFPKVLGVLLVIACFGYLADLFAIFLTPDLGDSVTLFVTVPAAAAGELTFMLWLLVKGVRIPTPHARVPATVDSSPSSRSPPCPMRRVRPEAHLPRNVDVDVLIRGVRGWPCGRRVRTRRGRWLG